MYILLSIFYASLLGIILMLLLKRREIRTSNPSLASRLGSGTDHLFHAVFSSVSRTISYINKHTFIVVAQWIAFHILLRIRKVYVEMKHRALVNPHSKKVIDAVRGRGQVSKEGASFYLRRISAEEK